MLAFIHAVDCYDKESQFHLELLKNNKENGVVSEFERNIIRKRQAEGIAKAKERGVYENRTRKTTIDRDEVKRLKAEGLSTYKIADAMSISRMSVHRILNQSA